MFAVSSMTFQKSTVEMKPKKNNAHSVRWWRIFLFFLYDLKCSIFGLFYLSVFFFGDWLRRKKSIGHFSNLLSEIFFKKTNKQLAHEQFTQFKHVRQNCMKNGFLAAKEFETRYSDRRVAFFSSTRIDSIGKCF